MLISKQSVAMNAIKIKLWNIIGNGRKEIKKTRPI